MSTTRIPSGTVAAVTALHNPAAQPSVAIDTATRRRYHELLRADIRTTAIATTLTFALGVIFWELPIIALCGTGLACLGLRQLGRRFVARDDLSTAILLFAFGLWTSALAILWVLPVGLPVMMFNLVTPVVVAGSFLDEREHRKVSRSAVAMAAALGAMAYFNDGFGVEDDIADWFVSLVIIMFMVEHAAMFTVAVRDANRVSAQNYADALAANESLAASEAELRRSRRRVVDVAERERRRIERDIHDGAQQRLVSAALQLQLAGLEAEQGSFTSPDRLDGIRAELQDAVNDLRELASGIYPSILADHGLRNAIQNLARLNPQTVDIDVPAEVDAPDRVVRSVYFIAVEALQNAAKHVEPDAAVRVVVSLDDHLHLTVEDSGEGFDTDVIGELGGLANMHDRAAAEGGTLSIHSDERGTTIAASIPTGVPA